MNRFLHTFLSPSILPKSTLATIKEEPTTD
jgi:hypothetical protein